MQKTKLKNIISDLPKKSLDKEIFETLLQNDNVKLERIISTGQITPDDHLDEKAHKIFADLIAVEIKKIVIM